MFGHGAEVAFGEAFSGDGESAVKRARAFSQEMMAESSTSWGSEK